MIEMPTDERPAVLIRGDALETTRQIPEKSIDLVLTDPPYNVSKPDINCRTLKNQGANAGKFDYGEWDYNFDPAPIASEFDRVCKPSSQLYVFTSSTLLREWLTALSGWQYKVLQWIKPDPLPQIRQRHWVSANEHVVWAWRGRYVFNWQGHSDMWSYQLCQAPKVAGDRCHPNQKPVGLLEKYIRVSSKEGDTVFDPFAGSGSTGEACMNTGRLFLGVEIDPNYHAIAKRRIDEAIGVGTLFPPTLPTMPDLYGDAHHDG